MANASQYKIVLEATYGSQVINNVFWCSQVGGGGASLVTDLLNHFETNWVIRLTDYQVDTYTHNSIKVYNWSDATDYGENNDVHAGEVIGAGMPSYMAYTIRFNRGGIGFNYPQKRVAGIPESLTEVNDLTAGTADAIKAAINDFFFGNWTSTIGASPYWYAVNPVPPYGTIVAPGVPAGTRVQQYTECLTVKLGTQNTRKP